MVSEYGETPLEAVDRFMHLEEMSAPDTLGPLDVLVSIKSASVGWVALIMASGQYQHMVKPHY